jgi:hypothetical protein
MKQTILLLGVLLYLHQLVLSQENGTGLIIKPEINGPYLGQDPPGVLPEKFASHIFDINLKQRKLCFSNDGYELYFTQTGEKFSSVKIYCMKEVEGKWLKPEVVCFSKDYINNDIALSPDNQTLYFISNRPDPNTRDSKMQPDIWFVNRDSSGNWGSPINAGPVVNSPGVEVQATLSTDNILYFANPKGILRSKFKNGEFHKPSTIEIASNSDMNQNSGPFPSIDNSCLIFHSNREGGFGSWDLYISFKNQNGEWLNPINMGKDINTIGAEESATLSPDGKYMFFTRDGKAYWVSTEIIEKLKPRELN